MAAHNSNCVLFDEEYYLNTYPEAVLSIGPQCSYPTAKEHWEQTGKTQCYLPNKFVTKPVNGNCNTDYYSDCNIIHKISEEIDTNIRRNIARQPLSKDTVEFIKKHFSQSQYKDQVIYILSEDLTNRINSEGKLNIQQELFLPFFEQCYLDKQNTNDQKQNCLDTIYQLVKFDKLVEQAHAGKINKLTLDNILAKSIEHHQLHKNANSYLSFDDERYILETLDQANSGQYIPNHKDTLAYLTDALSSKILSQTAISLALKVIKHNQEIKYNNILPNIWKIIDTADFGNDSKKYAIEYVGYHLKNTHSTLTKEELAKLSSFLKYDNSLASAAKFALSVHTANSGKLEENLDQVLNGQETISHINEKTELELWQEIKEANPEFYTKNTALIKKVQDVIKDVKTKETASNICSWQVDNIAKWRKAFDSSKFEEKLPEVMAVLKRAMVLSKNIEPRMVQLITTLMLYNSNSGRLAEVSTGEGKTTIVAMLAVLHILSGKQYVDIVTSSPVLAKDGKEKEEPFYNLFGITTDYNTEKDNSDLPKVYRSHIVYGTVQEFAGDMVHDIISTADTKVRGNRTTKVLIVDEVDNMFVDQSTHIVMLAEKLPRFEFLEPLLIAIWTEINRITDHGHVAITAELTSALKTHLTKFVESYTNRKDNPYPVPSNLKEFVANQTPNWAESAITALYHYEKDKHYIINRTSLNGHGDIILMDHSNTGTVLHDMVSSSSLHQFLQVKHLLPLTPEQLTTNYMSNVEFFKKYDSNIYGMTGTLGSEAEKKLISKTYGVDFIKIPTFKPKKLEILPGVIASGNDYIEVVLYSLLSQIDQGRAVLLIAPSKKEAEEYQSLLAELFAGVLQDKGYKAAQIKLYTRNDIPEIDVSKITLEPGDIIISTNLAGRGTDLKTSDKLEENGGLHVIVTSLPNNSRVEWQAFGRTARQGKAGTAQLIVDVADAIKELSATYPYFQEEIYSLEELTKWRNEANRRMMEKVETCGIPMMRLKDELYLEFRKTISEYEGKVPKAQSLRNNATIRQIEELWGIWLANEEKQLVCTSDIRNEQVEQIKTKARQEFEKFKSTVDEKYRSKQLVTNPSYVAADQLAIIEDLDRVIALDPTFSFMAHYRKAFKLLSSNNGAAIKQSLEAALDNLKEIVKIYNMPRLLLQPHQMESALAKQSLNKLDIIETLAYNIQNNIALVDAIIVKKTTQNEGEIRFNLGSCNKLNKAITNYQEIQGEVSEFIALFGSDEFCEVGYYVIPPEPDLSGNFFAAIFSVAQIALGFALPGSNFLVSALGASFMQHFSVGVVLGGIQGALSTAIATAEKKPIDVEQFLKSKGLELAATAILAGIKTGLEDHTLGKLLLIEKVESPTSIGVLEAGFIKELGKQAGIKAAVEVIKRGAEGVVNSNAGSIEESVRKALEQLFNKHTKELSRILALDIWDKNNHNFQQKMLFSGADSILASYHTKEEGAPETVLRQVIGGTGLAPLATARDIAVTYEKVTKVTDKFSKDYGSFIKEHVPAGISLLDAALQANGFGKNDVRTILQAMQASGALKDNEIDSCEQVDKLGVTQPEKVKTLCEKVQQGAGDLLNQEKKEQLTSDVTKKVTGKMLKLIHNGIVVPISHNVATFVWREIAGDSHPQTEAKESTNAAVKTLYTLDQAVFGGIGVLSASKLVVERSVEAVRDAFNPPQLPHANDHLNIVVEDRLAAIISLKGKDKDFTSAEAWALKYGYKYKLIDGKAVFYDHNGNRVDIERNYQLDQRHRAELAYIKILEEYYAGKRQHVPYGATLAVFDGDEPYVASDGKLYFKKPDGHKEPASKYEKHKFDPTNPPPARPPKQPAEEASGGMCTAATGCVAGGYTPNPNDINNYYDKAIEIIDKTDLPAGKKVAAEQAIKEFKYLSNNEKVRYLVELHNLAESNKFTSQARGLLGEFTSEIFGIKDAEAAALAIPITIEAAQIILTALTTAGIISWVNNKPQILSTPIHENEGTIHSTPIQKPLPSDKGFEASGYKTKDQGYQSPNPDNYQEGFDIDHGKDSSILAYKSNEELQKYKIEGSEAWIQEYNNWLDKVDPTKLQGHHVFSNKNKNIKEHNIFIDGYLDPKILLDPRNIMPLPKEKGTHETISIHDGRHVDDVIQELARNLGRLKSDIDSGIVNKDKAQQEFFKRINSEKEKLFKGEIKLNKKG